MEQKMIATKRLSTAQASVRLGISPESVGTLIKKGLLPALNLSSGNRPHYKIDEDDLARFIESRRTVGGSSS